MSPDDADLPPGEGSGRDDPLDQLASEVLDLIDEAVNSITDDDIDQRLQQLYTRTGRSRTDGPVPAAEPPPGSDTAQPVGQPDPTQAGAIMDPAQEHDHPAPTVLDSALDTASRITADAQARAAQIITDAERRAAEIMAVVVSPHTYDLLSGRTESHVEQFGWQRLLAQRAEPPSAATAEWELSAIAARAAQDEPDAKAELLARVRPMIVRYCRSRLGHADGGAWTTADHGHCVVAVEGV